MDRLLDVFFEILDAHAEAVEAHLTKRFHVRASGGAWIDFNANFGVGGKSETFAGVREQVRNLLGREISGRAAAPVELNDLTFPGNALSQAVNFFFQYGQVGWRNALVLANHHVASAE